MDVYVAGTRVGPQPIQTRERHFLDNIKVAQVAHQKNLLWILTRQTDQEVQAIPSWTGFNILTRKKIQISEDVVGYLPTINAPATELNTVFEIMNQSELVREELQLETIVVVMDQAVGQPKFVSSMEEERASRETEGRDQKEEDEQRQ